MLGLLLRITRITPGDLAFGVAFVFLGVLAVWTVHRPTLVQIDAVGVRLAEQAGMRAELNDMQAKVHDARSRTERLERRLASFEGRVLVSDRSGSYLDAVSKIQQRCGLEIEEIDPGVAITEGRHDVLPVRIVTRGTFFESVCFVHALESDLWSAELKEIQLRTLPNGTECAATVSFELHMNRTEDEGSDGPGDRGA